MVVPVLITSCQVSLKLKSGPVTTQTMTTARASRNAVGWPVQEAVFCAKEENFAVRGFLAPLTVGGQLSVSDFFVIHPTGLWLNDFA